MERYPYQGFYLVDTVIDISKDRFARDNITFATMRGISDLTNADLVVSKDALRYLPNKDVSYYLDYFSTYYKYAIVTNKIFANSYTNLDIPYGAGRALRLGQETFDRRIAVLVCWTITWQERICIKHACLLLGARGSPTTNAVGCRHRLRIAAAFSNFARRRRERVQAPPTVMPWCAGV